MEEVSLQEILLARETRAEKQKELQKKYSCPLICFTMNIAGPVKTSPLICRGFDEGISLLWECGFDHIVFPTERGIGSVSLQ